MIRRTYGCNACDKEWTLTHDSSDEYCERCPYCGAKSGWRPKPLRIKTNKSRAIDFAQKMGEEMGMTNMRDNTREGEAVAMAPRTPTTADNEALMSQTVQAMRELSNAQAGTVSQPMQQFLGATKNTLFDPTASIQVPSQLVGQPQQSGAGGKVVELKDSPMYQAARAATQMTLGDKQGSGMTPTGMLHKARKHERNTGDPRVPIKANIPKEARWRP